MSITKWRARSAGGFSLMEVLVALIVLSIGFVGYAALQMLGVRTNNQSMFRTLAIASAEEMAERIHANRVAANSAPSFYDGIDSDNIDCQSAPAANCDADVANGAPANCSLQQLATFDAFAVFCGVAGGNDGEGLGGISQLLPDGRLAVNCTPAAGACVPGSIHTIQVTWSEIETDQDSGADQDADGNTDFVTRTLTMQVLP